MIPTQLSPLRIRLILPSDLDIVEQMVLAGFGASPGRATELNRLLSLQPDSWFLAERDGEPLGMGGEIFYDLFAYINMMIVFPHAQRQGIGSAIFEHLLRLVDQRRCPLALLDATAMGEPLYRKHGFLEVDQARQYLCPHPPKTAHPHPGVYPVSYNQLREVAEFDAPIFGANRLKVFQAFLADFPDRLLAKRNAQGALTGYLFAQATRLGPWAALTPQDSADLLEAAFALSFDSHVDVIAPALNREAEALLLSAGFHFERALPHMVKGSSSVVRQRNLLYGQTSFALG
ncbi:MAG: GNAT family N-acetyltransferase [Chloroflexota bacterium]